MGLRLDNGRWTGGRLSVRRESHYADRVVDCIKDRPRSLHGLLAAAVARNASGEALVDGGLRSGQDILKAMASGADAAMMGRPWVYALAGAGEAGLLAQLKAFQGEFSVSMALTGLTSTAQINRSVIDGGA